MKSLLVISLLVILSGCGRGDNAPLTWSGAQEANVLCETHKGIKFIYPEFSGSHPGEYFKVECNDYIWINNFSVIKDAGGSK